MSESAQEFRGVPIVLGTQYGTEVQRRGILHAQEKQRLRKPANWRDESDGMTFEQRVAADKKERARIEELLHANRQRGVNAQPELDGLVEFRRKSRQAFIKGALGDLATEALMLPGRFTRHDYHDEQVWSAMQADLVDLEPPRGSK